jgi:glucose/arabinose dehydrogenase
VNYSTVALAAILIVLSPVAIAFGQGPTKTQPFGCEYYGNVMHCDLLLNDLQGYEVSGNSTIVHPVTNTEPLFVDGKDGQALQMRGEYRESIEMMNTPDVDPKQFSVSFWVKSTEIEPYGHIVSHSNKHQTAGWQFDTFGTNGPNGAPISTMRFGVFNTNGTLYSPADIVVPNDRFMHVVGTFDGSAIKVYEDGKLAGQTLFKGNYTADPGVPIRIGSAAYCASCNRWSGTIDEVRIYNRTLNDQEVTQLNGLSDISSGIVGNWKFDGNMDDILGKNPGTGTTMVTSMKFAPDGRLFFDEKNTGEIRIMTTDGKILDNPFASVQDVYVSWEQGMLGLTLDPDFQTNHYVYVYYTALVDTQNGDGGRVINKVLRFTEKDNIGTDMKVLLDNIPASRGFHSGGALAFGPDDKLYITVGDATEHIFAQDPSIVTGKVLRINRDGTIPEDNPYPNSPVYTTGHRNMYGITFGNDGTGVITENGDFHYDEINVIQKGGNYGFPTMQPPNLPPERANNSSIKPLRTYYDTIAPTQLIYYDGDAVPELKGMYLFGSFTGDIYAVKLSEDKKHIVEEIHVDLEHFPFVPTIAIAQSPDGKIYYGGYQIYTLDSIGKKSQSVFEVQLDAPVALNVNDLVVQPEQKNVEIDANATSALGPDSTLTARIPKALLENVTTVAIEGRQSQLSSEDIIVDDSNANYTSLTVKLGPVVANNNLKLSISGVSETTVVPEFPAAILMIAVVFAAVSAIATYGKRKGMI